jgi:hypothetical protein
LAKVVVALEEEEEEEEEEEPIRSSMLVQNPWKIEPNGCLSGG